MKKSTSNHLAHPLKRSHRASHALALLLAAGLAAPALAQNVHWNTGSGIWETPGNWTPFGMPLPFENVFVGSHAAAENATVWRDGFGPKHMAHLTITDGMTLRNDLGSFVVAGSTTLSGSNTVVGPFGLLTTYASRLLLEPMKGSSLTTHHLTLSNDARIDMVGQAFARVYGMLSVGSGTRVSGVGLLNMDGAGTNVVNNGLLRGLDGAGLTIRQNNGGLFDLDGTTGNGAVDTSAGYGSYLRIIGTALTDPFSGEVIMSRGSRLDMNLTEGWTADADSSIAVLNDNFGDLPATIRGGALTIEGEMDLASSLAIYSSAVTFEPSARVHLEDGQYMSVGSFGYTETTINGGVFTMDPTSNIAFHDHVTMRGGEFNMEPNAAGAFGRFRIYEIATWDGHISINGVAEMFGHATVAGPTVIDGDTFNMAASPFAPTIWDVNSAFALNANALTETQGNRNLATINVSGGVPGRFTLNLSDPQAAWTMEGELNLVGVGMLPVTRVGGSRMIVAGDLNVTGGLVQISSDTELSGAAVDIASGSTLRMRGRTIIDEASEFIGTGTLRNGIGGMMDLAPGATLVGTGLINEGLLTIGEGVIGVASVDRFASTSTATWEVDVGSSAEFATSDLLLVGNGKATLDGTLQVMLADLGASTIAPQVGDEFVILLALNGVSGTFANDPVTVVGPITYAWDVLYSPFTVVLRLESIVPSPGSMALLASGGLMACRRRRVRRIG